MKKQNLLRQVIEEEFKNYLMEETSITSVADVAIAKFVELVHKMPSLVNNVSKLKVEPSGSFFGIVLIDQRGNKVELARVPTEAVAKKMIPQVSDGIIKIAKVMKKNKIGTPY